MTKRVQLTTRISGCRRDTSKAMAIRTGNSFREKNVQKASRPPTRSAAKFLSLGRKTVMTK